MAAQNNKDPFKQTYQPLAATRAAMLSELLSPILNRQTQDPGSRAPRFGHRAFSISLLNSFGGSFVW